MSFNRSLEEVAMSLELLSGETRSKSGAVEEVWGKVQDVTLQISSIPKNMYETTGVNTDNVRYTVFTHIGVAREVSELAEGIYRLKDGKRFPV